MRLLRRRHEDAAMVARGYGGSGTKTAATVVYGSGGVCEAVATMDGVKSEAAAERVHRGCGGGGTRLRRRWHEAAIGRGWLQRPRWWLRLAWRRR